VNVFNGDSENETIRAHHCEKRLGDDSFPVGPRKIVEKRTHEVEWVGYRGNSSRSGLRC